MKAVKDSDFEDGDPKSDREWDEEMQEPESIRNAILKEKSAAI